MYDHTLVTYIISVNCHINYEAQTEEVTKEMLYRSKNCLNFDTINAQVYLHTILSELSLFL